MNPFLHPDHKRYFTARVGERLVGFLAVSPIPLRKGWYLEDVIREPNAPNGMATLLVAETLKRLKEEGAVLATLGTAPLAAEGAHDVPTENRRVARALDIASENSEAFTILPVCVTSREHLCPAGGKASTLCINAASLFRRASATRSCALWCLAA